MSNWIDWPPRGALVNRNYHIVRRLQAEYLTDSSYCIMIDFIPYGWRRQIRNSAWQLKMARYPIVRHGVGYQIYEIRHNQYVVLSWINGKKVSQQKSLWLGIKRFASSLSPKGWMLWGYHPGFAEPYLDSFCSSKIFDVVDDWRTHDVQRKSVDYLDKSYRKIVDSTDLVFGVSRGALKAVAGEHPNAHWVANGVDLAHYAACSPKKTNPITIGYVGIIENRLDHELVAHLARNRPEWEFKFAGKVFPGFKGRYLQDYKNVKFIGQVPYSELPRFMSSITVGIVPHKINEFTESMNPLKIYEYLAAGLSCVTTPVAGSEQFGKHIMIAATVSAFEMCIESAAASNSLKNITGRKEFVARYSWDNRFNEMKQWIFQ